MIRFAMTALLCAAATLGAGVALANAAGAADLDWAGGGWAAAAVPAMMLHPSVWCP